MRFRRREPKVDENAQIALDEARQTLDEIKSRGQEVSELVSEMDRLRRRNHFAEQLTVLLSRTPRKRFL